MCVWPGARIQQRAAAACARAGVRAGSNRDVFDDKRSPFACDVFAPSVC